MKVTLQWMLITVLLCLAHCIAASPYDNSKYLQEKYFSPKRTKPSLSIVNPLDVLRQRIMLEMARRQMRENTKQVEMNKAILKTIGKRGNEIDYNDIEDYIKNRYYDTDIIATPFVNNERSSLSSSSSNNQDDGKVMFSNSNKNFNYKNHYNRKPTNTLTNEVVDNLQIGNGGGGGNGPDERSVEAAFNDGNNDVATDGNDEAQVKYIYSLYKSRLLNNM